MASLAGAAVAGLSDSSMDADDAGAPTRDADATAAGAATIAIGPRLSGT